jgi:taurine dioxygenase
MGKDSRVAETTGGPVCVFRKGRYLAAEISGIDLSQPLDDTDFTAVQRAFLENELLIFRGQDIDPAQFMAFGRRFGDLTVHPFSPTLAGTPELIILDNHADNPPKLTDIWHSDETFREAPPKATLLRTTITPALGGDTMFASMTAAFDGLGDATQRLICGLEGIFDFKPFRTLFGDGAQDHQRLRELEEQYPLRRHPIVRVHPESGRKSIFVNRQFTIGIDGMKDSESGPLLAMLFDQANRPEYQYRLCWRPHKLVLWDNRAVQHYAIHDYYPQRRRMERVTIKGDVPFGIGAGYDGPVIDRQAIELGEQDAVPNHGKAPVRQTGRTWP